MPSGLVALLFEVLERARRMALTVTHIIPSPEQREDTEKRTAKRPGHPRTNGQDHEKARAGGNNLIYFSSYSPNSSILSPDFEVLNPHDNLHDFRHTLYGRSCQLSDYHDIDNQSDTT